MARDDELMKRLYGERAPAPAPEASSRRAAFWAESRLPPLFLGFVLVLGLSSFFAASLSAISMLVPTEAELELRRWGVLEPGMRIVAYQSDDPEGRSGCVLGDAHLVRWDDQALTARVPLDDVLGLDLGQDVLTARIRGGEQLACPVSPGETGQWFVASTRRSVAYYQAEPWGPGGDARMKAWRAKQRAK